MRTRVSGRMHVSEDPALSEGLSYYTWRVFVGMSYFPVERRGEDTHLCYSSQREVSALDFPHRKYISPYHTRHFIDVRHLRQYLLSAE